MTMVKDKLLTVHNVAEQLKVSEYTVRSWLNTGRLKGFRPGGDKAGWRIEQSEVARFIARAKGEQAAPEEPEQ